jgi:phenylalanyl-tRNA synthetase beta chain
VSGEQIKNLSDHLDLYIELDNPLAKDKPYLRRDLLPNLLSNIASNINQNQEVKIFEIGKVFRGNKPGLRVAANSDELLPRQDVWFTALYVNKKNQNPYWEARRIMESIGKEINLDWATEPEKEISYSDHPTRTAAVSYGGQIGGVVGEILPSVAKKFGINYRVGFLMLNLSDIQEAGKFKEVIYQPSSIFPEVERDVAFLVDKEVNHLDLVNVLKTVDVLIREVELFDVYMGEKIAANKKSVAYRIVYADPTRTLVGAEVDKIHKKVITTLQNKFGAEIR